jgi:hypothetical protein
MLQKSAPMARFFCWKKYVISAVFLQPIKSSEKHAKSEDQAARRY